MYHGYANIDPKKSLFSNSPVEKVSIYVHMGPTTPLIPTQIPQLDPIIPHRHAEDCPVQQCIISGICSSAKHDGMKSLNVFESINRFAPFSLWGQNFKML